MRIALIRHSMNQPQGGARLVALLARDLAALGADVTLYCYEFDRDNCFPDQLGNVTIRSVLTTDSPIPAKGQHETGASRYAAQLRRYYLECPRVASLITPGTEVLNPHEWPAHRTASLFARAHGTPVVWTYNDPNRWHLKGRRGLLDFPARLFGRLDNAQVNRFTAITTLSEWMGRVARDTFAAPVFVVRCGIDVPPVERSRVVDKGFSRLRLVSVGVLAPWRRFEDAIQGVMFARERGCDCDFEIIGSDRYAPEYGAFLRGLIEEYDIGDRVRLRFGSVSEKELENAYAEADVAVFPNESQAWGLAQLEAMARGIPTIISRGAGVSEILLDQQHALLVDPRQPKQIADAIEKLAKSTGLREAVAEQGRSLVIGSYTSMHYAAKMLKLFHNCTLSSVRD